MQSRTTGWAVTTLIRTKPPFPTRTRGLASSSTKDKDHGTTTDAPTEELELGDESDETAPLKPNGEESGAAVPSESIPFPNPAASNTAGRMMTTSGRPVPKFYINHWMPPLRQAFNAYLLFVLAAMNI